MGNRTDFSKFGVGFCAWIFIVFPRCVSIPRGPAARRRFPNAARRNPPQPPPAPAPAPSPVRAPCPHRSSFVSPAAMHLLGLNWQLQPADGHTFNNGMRPGLPGAEDAATMPSGGRGELAAAAPGSRLRAAGFWDAFSHRGACEDFLRPCLAPLAACCPARLLFLCPSGHERINSRVREPRLVTGCCSLRCQ